MYVHVCMLTVYATTSTCTCTVQLKKWTIIRYRCMLCANRILLVGSYDHSVDRYQQHDSVTMHAWPEEVSLSVW